LNTRVRREEIKLALKALENKGKLNPKDVFEAAKDPSNVLHQEFDWDKDRAAQQHWLDTARSLIRSYVVEVKSTITNTVLEAPMYVRNPGLPAHQEGYVTVSEVKNSTDGPLDLYRIELSRVVSFIDRLEALSVTGGFSEHFAEIAGAAKKIRSVMARLNTMEEV